MGLAGCHSASHKAGFTRKAANRKQTSQRRISIVESVINKLQLRQCISVVQDQAAYCHVPVVTIAVGAVAVGTVPKEVSEPFELILNAETVPAPLFVA